MAKGKKTCKILKEIRRQIAEANDIAALEIAPYRADDLLYVCARRVRRVPQLSKVEQALRVAVGAVVRTATAVGVEARAVMTAFALVTRYPFEK